MGVTLGQGLGIIGIVAFAGVIWWLMYSIYVGIRNERLMLAARQQEQITSTRERMKLTASVSETTAAKDQESTSPTEGVGKLGEEHLFKRAENSGNSKLLDGHSLGNIKAEEHNGYVYLETGPSERDLEKGQRWKLATL